MRTRLESDVDVGSVDGGRPPQGEPAVGDLVETRSLCVRELLVLHRLLEPACLFSTCERPLPRRRQHHAYVNQNKHARLFVHNAPAASYNINTGRDDIGARTCNHAS